MATDQEFRDLEAVVATLRRDLRESQDTINLWRQNGLGHLYSGSGKWRFGGNVMQLDNNGMQVNASATAIVLRLVEELASDPNLLESVGRLWGTVFGDSVTFYHDAINTGGFGRLLTTATSTGHEAYLRTFSPYADASMGLSDDTGGAIAYVAGARFLFAQCTLSPGAITGDEDDFNPTGLPNTTILRLSTDASHNVTGLAGGSDGRLLLIFNVGSFDIVLKDEDAGSDAANRFALDGDITLAPDTGAILWYDATSSRWRCAGRYSAGGGAGDVATDTLWDALGDLAVGSGANTANNLPVGTDGYVLTADSTDLSFGIKWAPAAGGPGGSTSIARTLMLMGA